MIVWCKLGFTLLLYNMFIFFCHTEPIKIYSQIYLGELCVHHPILQQEQAIASPCLKGAMVTTTAWINQMRWVVVSIESVFNPILDQISKIYFT